MCMNKITVKCRNIVWLAIQLGVTVSGNRSALSDRHQDILYNRTVYNSHRNLNRKIEFY
jgi:hypothetical protein